MRGAKPPQRPMRRMGGCAAVLLALAAWPALSQAASCTGWPLWERFRETYITQDARVVDPALPHRPTVSEGQAYAMFFALVVGDRQRFAALLHWTQNNMARGDLTRFAPGWEWGRSAQGRWELLDANPASDADLWMAYTLLEAGRLWQHDTYTRLGQALATHVLRDATRVLPGLGRSLLPAPTGFQLGPDRWRLNPSYAPVPLLRRLAVLTGRDEWQDMVEPTLRLTLESAAHGISPEWTIWDASLSGWQPDPQSLGMGSYNAIRTYLWTGMSLRDPAFERLALGTLPWLHWVGRQGHAPEALDAANGTCRGPVARKGPPGFDAAALVLADSLRFDALARQLRARVDSDFAGPSPGYYSHVLALFGLGWIEGRYRFTPEGALLLAAGTCLAGGQ